MSGDKLYSVLNEPEAMLYLSRSGINFKLFQEIVSSTSFSLKEWSRFLHLTERTLQRYKKEEKKFEPLQSEKIIEIARLYQSGEDVFGTKIDFENWLNSKNIALGNILPLELLDSSFGIDILMDELGRIEHGILA